MKRLFAICLFSFLVSYMVAQNMTDRTVMNDKLASKTDLDDWTIGPAIDDSVFLCPDRVKYDSRCLQIEGKDVFLLSGTMHYFRTPQPLWRDRLQKIKQMGFNCVETYVPWNWHEREMPSAPDDFSKVDLRELDDFLSLAEEVGLYAIVRPGPYICAEWSGGGFPQWLMQKRPTKTLHEVWLQSMDSTFIAWNDHWYQAVARVVTPHQLSRKPKGAFGVVLMQVENEFNRIKWFPRSEKRQYLEHMAQQLRKGGIDIPLITCWTDEARNVSSGPLNGIVDMVNSYPRWQIRKGFGRLINQQLKSQPGKPLISGELQGGWSSDLRSTLSWDMDGQTAAQTQNITLYALQRGFCALNYYMLVGGTNLDDWAARDQTASYDFAAAIGEDGTINERYYRLQSLAELIAQHGTQMARARIEDVPYESNDTLVELLVRRTTSGDRYLFVRTEDYIQPHAGMLTITLDGQARHLPYALEPFGSRVFYLPAKKLTAQVLALDDSVGQWWPRRVANTGRPPHPQLLSTFTVQTMADPLPSRWTKLPEGKTVDALGHYDRHYLYYKIRGKVNHGGLFTVPIVGKNKMNNTDADEVMALADGKSLVAEHRSDTTVCFNVPQGTRQLLLLYDPRGLHHHTNLAVERNWLIGPRCVWLDGKAMPLSFAATEKQRGVSLTEIKVKSEKLKEGISPLKWVTASFSLNHAPLTMHHKPLWLHIEQQGNGFVYVNGHCLGRCYNYGPQHDFYIPDNWLHHDDENHVAISLMPNGKTEASVTNISLMAATETPRTWAFDQPNGRWGDQGDGTFRNPILRADYSDPDPLRVGDDYYLVASTFEDYPGVTILHSKDLVNWQTIGAAFTHLNQVSEDYTWKRMRRYNGGVYAPTITYHNGRYFIYANLYTDGFYMAWAEKPEGPWHEQMLRDREGRLLKVPRWSDPCPLWDDDGKAYLMTSHPRRTHWYSYLFQMSSDGTQLLDADSAALAANTDFYEWPKGGTVVSPYHSSEGNRIFKKDGYYYLQHIEFTNLGQGEGTYIARSRHIYGTHEDGTPGTPGNPGKYEMKCIERVYSRDSMLLPGQGGYVTTPDGRWLWIGQFTRDEPEGRVPWLVPVRWDDGWPVLGDANGRAPLQMAKPVQVSGSKFQDPYLPQGSDEFEIQVSNFKFQGLSPLWRWNHTPRNDYWSLSERPGWLRLKAFRPANGGGFFQAGNTLMQHTMPSDSTVIETRLDVRLMAAGQRAGLAVFNGGKSYALIGICDGHVYFETDGTVSEGPALKKSNRSIRLRVYINKEDKARFVYCVKGRRFLPLGTAYQLAAGNFRGARVGLFSYNTSADSGIADFDYFNYQIKNR